MHLVKVAGLDPSLRNWGLARGAYNIETGAVEMEDISLIQTENEAGKTVRKSSDDLRCANELVRETHAWIADAAVVFAEVPSGSQSARGSFSNGICLGVLGSIGTVGSYRGSLIQVTPTEVKRAAVGSKNAAKHEIIEWAIETWPALPWPVVKRGKNKGAWDEARAEHMADACAAIYAGVLTPEFKTLVSILRMGGVDVFKSQE